MEGYDTKAKERQKKRGGIEAKKNAKGGEVEWE